MSKISLEPNDSGAGTFSIVSPDSNTNRTLNLPDEAGKLLSTGNDDPAEVFKQSNILGTVSESGGVPTGAIIERGSNSNGEFIKYADGTLICLIVRTLENVNNNIMSRGGTTPHPFVDANYFGVLSGNDSASGMSSGNERGHLFVSNTRSDFCTFRMVNRSDFFSSTDVLNVSGILIGRWF